VHSFEVRRAIGNVSTGAVITTYIVHGFQVYDWLDTRDYAPGALTNVDPRDGERFR
jgi:hypothetical protein